MEFSKTSTGKTPSKKAPLKLHQPQLRLAKSKHSQNNLQNISKLQIALEKHKQALQKLPKRSMTLPFPAFKNKEDSSNYYKYLDTFADLDKRSRTDEVLSFIESLIEKSETSELSKMQKYLLSSYIDIYIKETYTPTDKDNSEGTLERVRVECQKVCKIWEFYVIKQNKCNFGQKDFSKFEKMELTFQLMNQELMKIDHCTDKLEHIRRILKRFYAQIVA